MIIEPISDRKTELEDLKCSPNLLNNVKISHTQLRLNIQTYFVLIYIWAWCLFWSNDLNIFIYMMSALTFIERFSNINALIIKFGLAVKKVMVNPDSSFVHNW